MVQGPLAQARSLSEARLRRQLGCRSVSAPGVPLPFAPLRPAQGGAATQKGKGAARKEKTHFPFNRD